MQRPPSELESPATAFRARIPPPRILAVIAAGAVVAGALLAAVIGSMPGSPPPSPFAVGSGGSSDPSSHPSAATGSATPSVPASGSAAPSPTAHGSATASTQPVARDLLPIKGSGLFAGTEIHMASGPSGGLFMTIPNGTAGVVAVLLGADGTPRPGWPVVLGSAYCQTLLVADDASVRVLCDPPSEDDGLQVPMTRVFALDEAGRPLPGWPIDIEAVSATRMVKNDLTALIQPYRGDDAPAADLLPVHVAVVSADGRVRSGTDIQFACCDGTFAIGPDGTGFVTDRRYRDTAVTTDIIAFGLDGARAGWPVVIDGDGSDIAFDGTGRVYSVVAGATRSSAHVVIFDQAGGLASSSDDLSIASTNPWTGAGSGDPGPPIVADDGTAYVLSADGGTTIQALGPAGSRLAGWPWRSKVRMPDAGFCGAQDAGCGKFRTTPRVGASGILYVALRPASSSVGGSLQAIGPSGHLRAGWPVGLKRAGSTFWALEVRPGGLWALAIERETRGYSATILSIDDDSTVQSATTIVQP